MIQAGSGSRSESEIGCAALRAAAVALAAAVLALPGSGAAAQSTLDRPPNLSGAWTGPSGVVHFHFVHRFNQAGPPTRQVSNQPTFLLAYSFAGALAGVQYATRSDVEPGMPNEWEPFARVAHRSLLAGAAEVGLTGAYNVGVRAPAAELTLGVRGGPLLALGVMRVLGGGSEGGARGAAGGGIVARIGTHVALAADAVTLFDREAGERVALGAGLQLRIPQTPHTLSLQATNTNSATLHGSSRGSSRLSYGFEFTVPVTLRRYIGRGRATPASPPPVAGDTVVAARMENLAYAPDSIVVSVGTTIEWRNADPLDHTVTADDGSWDSGDIAPGAVWRRRFDTPGRFPFHCAPHPFMTGVVIVQP